MILALLNSINTFCSVPPCRILDEGKTATTGRRGGGATTPEERLSRGTCRRCRQWAHNQRRTGDKYRNLRHHRSSVHVNDAAVDDVDAPSWDAESVLRLGRHSRTKWVPLQPWELQATGYHEVRSPVLSLSFLLLVSLSPSILLFYFLSHSPSLSSNISLFPCPFLFWSLFLFIFLYRSWYFSLFLFPPLSPL